MFLYLYNRFKDVKPVVLDGILYILISMTASIELVLTSEEVYKYVNPYVIFYAKSFIAVIAAGVGSLKMFRDKSYTDHLAEKKAANNLTQGQTIGNTTIITKQP